MAYFLETMSIICCTISLLSFQKSTGQEKQKSENNTAYVIKTEKAPIIDGTLDELWKASKVHQIDNLIDGQVTNNENLNAEWRALWTSTHLYLFVTVVDDKKLMDSPGHSYLDDQIELFITADNKKPKSYFEPPTTNTFAYENPRNEKSFESHKGKVNHIETKAETPTGWTLEIAIPFSDWNIEPGNGYKIGIDVQVNDDDDPTDQGKRDAKISWNSLTDVDGGVAFNPRLQGTAIFIDE